MLDGLDEVKPEFQADFVAAINAYIEKHKLPGLAVCCRLQDYFWLPERLKMNDAISIKPLSQEQINHYLDRAGSQYDWLKTALVANPVLRELAESPFM